MKQTWFKLTRQAFVFLISFGLLFSVSALEPQVAKLVEYETLANAVAVRSTQMFRMEHFEIPLRLVTVDFASKLDTEIGKSLILVRNGEKYVRWVINPEDTKWHLEVEKFLTANGIKPERKKYFQAYQTASRSYIVEDPNSGVQFSIKSSTDKTGGHWRDKKQEYADAFDIRRISDFVQSRENEVGFSHLKVMYEPLVFGIQAIDQSVVIRDLAGLQKGTNIYLPGFSALHENVGREIARINGSDNPAKFWNEHYVKKMGHVVAEFVAKTGVWLDSPHSQNFLIELDKDFKPTGKIIIRDLGDVFIIRPIVEALGRKDIADKFSEQSNVKTEMPINFGPLHGNKAPSWISQLEYQKWGKTFEKSFTAEFSRQSGIPLRSLGVQWQTSPFSYIQGIFPINQNANFKTYLRNLANPIRKCSALFAKAG